MDQTQSNQKIVFNTDDEEQQTCHLKIINNSDHRLGWAIKTNNVEGLVVNPERGVLDPKEAVLMAVTCDAFDFGQEDTNNATVEFNSAPEGTAK